jgi:hypothetical protein
MAKLNSSPSEAPAKSFPRWRQTLALVLGKPLVRELLVLAGLVILTSIMTWPWVIHLRNACSDPGDPYLHSYVMWWDYHQTFADPLRLFQANIFYPLPYTLAFTEHDYGIAMLFFPLYALGLRPLTVISIASFLGFAFSGYGAFRLTRTLTGSVGAAWIGGIAFAFAPFRFQVLAQITYVFAGWIPLLLEALVLFARNRSWKRAAWLSVAFTMNGLTCLTWMFLSLVPLIFSAVVLVVSLRLWRDRKFWIRGAAAAAGSFLLLFPFLLPYLRVSKLYGFTWGPELVTKNSPTVWNWLVADYPSRLWRGLGEKLGTKGARLFPGLVTPALALFSLFVSPLRLATGRSINERAKPIIRWLVPVLDAASVGATLFIIGSLALAESPYWKFLGRVFAGPTLIRSVVVLSVALIVRLVLVYPSRLTKTVESVGPWIAEISRSRLGEAFWLGWIWAVVGFLLSLGMNSSFFRLLFDYAFIFRSMREPGRAAMIVAVGLSLLAGVGVVGLIRVLRVEPKAATVVVMIVGGLLLFDLRVAPMNPTLGAVDPDELAVWLKQKSIRGGLVELPTGTGTLPHLYMLRAADHGKPLINAIATFVPPHVTQINDLSREAPIPFRLLDVLESVPTSYLIIHNDLIDSVRAPVYELFLAHGIASKRLRFIRRLGMADVYAVTKVEPDAAIEQTPAPGFLPRDWAASLEDKPENLAGLYLSWSQRLYRLHLLAEGRMPRYQELIDDAKKYGVGVFAGDDDQFRERELRLAEQLVREKFSQLPDADFVNRVLANGGLAVSSEEHQKFISHLADNTETRGTLLVTLANDQRLIDREKNRSLVLIHFFAYLQRNPGDPPDKDTSGFDFWVEQMRQNGGIDLTAAFSNSVERRKMMETKGAQR